MKEYLSHLGLNIKCSGYSLLHMVNHLAHGVIPAIPLINK